MSSAAVFELLTEDHLHDVLDIYNYYVKNSVATFQLTEIDLDEMRKQVIFPPESRFVSYVMLEEGKVVGYVSVAQFKTRAAYDITGDIALYLSHECVGRKLGKLAVEFIEKVARERNFHSIMAVITAENDRSTGLFASMGFEEVARFREVGKKFDRLLDVVSLQKILK